MQRNLVSLSVQTFRRTLCSLSLDTTEMLCHLQLFRSYKPVSSQMLPILPDNDHFWAHFPAHVRMALLFAATVRLTQGKNRRVSPWNLDITLATSLSAFLLNDKTYLSSRRYWLCIGFDDGMTMLHRRFVCCTMWSVWIYYNAFALVPLVFSLRSAYVAGSYRLQV